MIPGFLLRRYAGRRPMNMSPDTGGSNVLPS
jgi:hypothetical protein